MPELSYRIALVMLAAWGGAGQVIAQETATPRYRVDVNLVAVTFSVADAKGRPVHGLKSADIRVSENGAPQQIAAFAEGSIVRQGGAPGILPGTAVFILFDTSNPMYTSLPYLDDAIAEFLRHLDPADAAAIYTFSRNLSRAAVLTRDRAVSRAGLAEHVAAGDDTALFDCLLLTLRDAAKVPGQKAVVVFSNGPDNRSRLSPYDVGTVAVDAGIPVYVVSMVNPVKDRLTAEALKRLASRTGGQLYLAAKWQAAAQALAEVRDQIGASYTAYYYPADSSDNAFRHITVEIATSGAKSYTIRSREGYQPKRTAAAKSN